MSQAEGGLYGGASAIKSKLLPLLGSGLGCSGLNSSVSMSALNASSSRVMELDELKRAYAKSLEKIEVDMGQPSRTGAEASYDRDEGGRRRKENKQDKYAKDQHLYDLKSK
ncbi:hypothetical protein FGIG_09550 [Fasciola gigantica]|uniref:Uncharacterized protein n=1 Tax=Fasciola gigantica TaxID=46835 RepID=A0A504YQA3_FASGI|nr:hypothetical protein FGIG_09550 [Fasciola gigantica]